MRILMLMANPGEWISNLWRSFVSLLSGRIAESIVSALVAVAIAVSGMIQGVPVAVLIVLGLMGVVLALWVMLMLQRWRYHRAVSAEVRQERKERTARWREFIGNFDRERDGPIARSVVYSEMRPHLQRHVIQNVEGRMFTISLGNRDGSLPMLLDEISRLEREWDLI